MLDFIVIGLPRSGTTWLSNWLTTDTTVCLHDPFAHLMPEELEGQRNGKRLGISCTGAYLLPWLKTQECPVAVIQRDVADCAASLAAMGLHGATGSAATDLLAEKLAEVGGRRWQFADIWIEEKARELWAFLLPGIPFDSQRYRLLTEMQIQPHMGKWTFDPSIAERLLTNHSENT